MLFWLPRSVLASLPQLGNLLPVASSKTAQLLSLLLGHGSGLHLTPSVPQRSQVPLGSRITSVGALWLGKTWQTASLFVHSVIPCVDQGWACCHMSTLGKKWCAEHGLGSRSLHCQRQGQRLPERLYATFVSPEDGGCLGSRTIPCISQNSPRDCCNLCRPEIAFTAILQLVLLSFSWKWISTKLEACSCTFAEVSVQLYWPWLCLRLPKKAPFVMVVW